MGKLSVEKLQKYEREVWVIAILIYGVGDLVTTFVGLRHPDIIEIGPIAQIVISRFNQLALLPFKVVVFAVFGSVWYLLPPSYRLGVPYGIATAGVLVVSWNIFVMVSL